MANVTDDKIMCKLAWIQNYRDLIDTKEIIWKLSENKKRKNITTFSLSRILAI